MMSVKYIFFFFKQKTAYEMRISDWSSDVCSSDLMTAKDLGFREPMANSLDAVSDRDFALEFLSAMAICAVHLSRLAEEIVIWTSAQFRFVTLSVAFTRPEAPRVGTECCRTCRYRWAAYI